MGIFTRRNNISIAFALPHANSWMEAHPDMPIEVKDRIVKAYEKIHDKGVLHSDVGLRHILVGDDHKAMIIDFNISRALHGNWGVDLEECEKVELEREIREVRVKLRCEGAIEDELRLIERYKELKRLEDEEVAARKQKAREDREAGRSKKRKREFLMTDDHGNQVVDTEGKYDIFSDTDDVREEDKVHGVDERTLQTEEKLYKWIVTKDVSRRMIVPGRTPDLNSLPIWDPDRKEDELTMKFLRSVMPEHYPEPSKAASPKSATPPGPTLPEPTLPPALGTPTVPTTIPRTPPPRSLWSLPRRVFRNMSRYLSFIIPLAFPWDTPSQPSESIVGPDSTDADLQERPRKKARWG